MGRKIQGAVERYVREKGMSDQLNGYQWEFNLVESKEVNAWCMPGGKVVVYTGILPVTKDDNGLAVVMGHEIAHAVAQHGNERMSQELIAQYGGMALNEALASKPAETKQLWMTAFGAGVQVGALLPFSRTAGERGGSSRLDLHGHGRLRSGRCRDVLATYGATGGRKRTAGIPEHASFRPDPDREDPG